jgi:hypothetical protein
MQRVFNAAGMLVCGAVAVSALWVLMDTPRNPLLGLAAWGGLVIGGAGTLGFLILGLVRNTEAARRASQTSATATPTAFFPHAPDASLARRAAELLRIPQDQREERWEAEFYGTIAAAALIADEPAQFTAPDGMAYASFRLDESSTGSNQLALTTAAATLAERGIGAVLNKRADGSAEWVFSCGDLLSLRLYGQIKAAPVSAQSVTEADHEVLAASPSEAFLPGYTRAFLRRFMHETLGISTPSVFLIVDAAVTPPESLVFNVSGQQLAAGWTEEAALRYVHWFLPRHYRTISVPAGSSLARQFRPL